MQRSKEFNRFRLNGKIRTKKLIVGCSLKLDLNEKSTSTRAKRSKYASLNHPRINIKSINGIDWDAFVRSLYRKGVSTAINGNLIISMPTSTQSIHTNEINGVPTANVMTLGTDQVIDTIFLSKKYWHREASMQKYSMIISILLEMLPYLALITLSMV